MGKLNEHAWQVIAYTEGDTVIVPCTCTVTAIWKLMISDTQRLMIQFIVPMWWNSQVAKSMCFPYVCILEMLAMQDKCNCVHRSCLKGSSGISGY